MGFYDSVKEDVRGEEEGGQGEDAEDEEVPFDQLKEDAEDKEEPGEKEPSSNTDIEVLGDGGLEDEGRNTAEQTVDESETTRSPERPSSPDTGEGEVSTPGDPDTVELLRRIEEQNQEMLNVLRGIKRSLE